MSDLDDLSFADLILLEETLEKWQIFTNKWATDGVDREDRLESYKTNMWIESCVEIVT